MDKFDGAGVRHDSLQVFKHIHGCGPRQLAKGASFPLESSNAASDSSRANDGAGLATTGVEADRASAGIRPPMPSWRGAGAAPHADSIRSRTAGPTDTDAEPREGETFAQWLKRQAPRKLTLGAASAIGTHLAFPEEAPRGRPNSGDSDRDDTRAERGNRFAARERRAFWHGGPSEGTHHPRAHCAGGTA